MEQKHTTQEIQDYTIAQECLITTIGWCNDLRNHATEQDAKLVSSYIKELFRLLDSIDIGSSDVQEVLNKYAPLIKNDKLDIHFIKNDYRKFKPVVQNTLLNKKEQLVHKHDDIDFIHPQTASVASVSAVV